MFAPVVATAAFALLPAVLGQFVPAPTDLKTATGYANISVRYKEVETGICELDPNVKSYSGYADVGQDEHLFFWFFEARDVDPSDAPLSVWINGGPGSSSMIGLFQELGPCGVDSNGDVYNNPYSFSKVSNMIFIDQPVDVGFSYSVPVPAYENTDTSDIIVLPNNTCPDYAEAYGTCGTYSTPNETLTANSTAAAAPNLWKALQGFMGAFPQYSRNEFAFTTESYGGKYGPIFSEYFETQNALNISGAHEIRLSTLFIGNGWFDPHLQYQAYYNFTVYPGNTYDYSPFNESISNMMYNALYGPGNCIDQIAECAANGVNEICSAGDNFCAEEVESVYDNILNRDEYDVRELMPDPFPYEFYVDYLNTPKVQKAIGAYQNFSESSNTVGNAFGATGDDGRESGTVEAIRKLLKQGITVALYHGDADYNCNWLGGEAVSNEIDAPGFCDAGYVNITTSDNVVHGQVKQSGAFSFSRVYESGHEVPFYQPVLALALFERAIAGKDIATGKTSTSSSYKTEGPAKSTYREGNSTIQLEVVDPDATYNTTLNGPDPASNSSSSATSRRSLPRHFGKLFKP
ncbi:MAG: hypothetical protein M4579_002631 [Chaenotheca gracillima]|nr:MAG: hypothetical protein M4579_002631 [Chaenotheca gracillima]